MELKEEIANAYVRLQWIYVKNHLIARIIMENWFSSFFEA